MTLKEALDESKIYAKLQSMQHQNVECTGQLHRCVDGAGCLALQKKVIETLKAKMKKDIKLSCTVKNMFAGKSDKVEEKKIIKKQWMFNKGIHIDTLTQELFEVKIMIRSMLKSPSQTKRHGAPVKLVPKWSNKLNVRLQENIQKAEVAQQQIMLSVASFEASGLSYLDNPISGEDKTTPRQVMLNLKGSEEETNNEKIFISVENNRNGNIVLYYKKE